MGIGTAKSAYRKQSLRSPQSRYSRSIPASAMPSQTSSKRPVSQNCSDLSS